MFSRVSNAAHICLRCQLRLRRPASPRPNPPFILASAKAHRFQSVAALQVDEEDVQASDPDERSVSAGAKKEDAFRKRHKKKLSKRWRPSPTAELGMNALGKPSEVLLLSPRDRKIPVVPKESIEDVKESFYESVASEKQPSTWEQVKENIGQAREQIQQPRGVLTPEIWCRLRKVMDAGFTQSQLRRYFQEASGPETRPKKKILGKELIIKLIAKHIWNFELPPQAEKQRPEKQLPLPPCSKEQQIAIERSPTANVRKTASQHGVKISFDQKRTVVSGPGDYASEVHAALKEQISTLEKITLVLGGHTGSLRDQNREEDLQILVEMLAQKYGVHATIKGLKGELRIGVLSTASNRSSVDRLHHDLRLTLTHQSKSVPYISSLRPQQEVFLKPYSSPEISAVYPYPKDLRRAQVIRASSLDTQPSIVSTTTHERLHSGTSAPKKSNFANVEYAAEFGMALFNNDAGSNPAQNILSTKEDLGALHTINDPHVPFLPQLLAGLEMQESDPARKGTVTARLSLTSLDHHVPGHALEVELRSGGHLDAFARTFQLQRISLIDEGREVNLLQPTLPTDIRLSHQHRLELYNAKTPQASEVHTAISTYLGSLLQAPNAQSIEPGNASAPTVPLFLELPMMSELVPPQPTKQAGTISKYKKSAERSSSRTYFLSDFAIVDKDSYEFEHDNNRYTLDYVNYSAQNPNDGLSSAAQKHVMANPFRDRQILVMRCDCSLAVIKPETRGKASKHKKFNAIDVQEKDRAADKAKFESFFSAATWIAKRIGQEGNKFAQRMAGIK